MATSQGDRHWRSTACILCYINCGVEVATEGRNLVRVRGRSRRRDNSVLTGEAMTAKEWFTGFAAELGITPPTGDEVRDLLQLAGEAAHASERLAAPVTCWLIARAGITPAEALQALTRWKERGFPFSGERLASEE